MNMFALLFGLRARVRRRPYLAWGFGLALLKFAVDSAIVFAFTRQLWSPLGYVVPSLVLRDTAIGATPEALHVLLPVVALPFLWIGLSMSVRRAADAGLSPWVGTLFVVPLLNYAVNALLGARPSSPSLTAPERPNEPAPYRADPPAPVSESPLPVDVRVTLVSLLVSAAIGLSMIGLCVYGLGLYGVTLFFMTPFAMGVTSRALYNRERLRSFWATLAVAVGAVLLAGCMCLLFAIEGVLCLAMAFPIAASIAVIGAVVARSIVSVRFSGEPRAPALLLVLPAFAFGEARVVRPTLRDVTTSIEIDAAPEQVWPNVVGFGDLDEPPDWFFRLGIAYPKRARITGEGVDAVRRCEFSTGAFVEPITEWAPPTKLAFDVTSQPPSLTEWSPYRAIHAPHLEGYMVSKGGQFELVRLPGGRTRLDGTTHYTLAIDPELYWTPFAEALLHAIHYRVLAHIKRLSEGARPTPA